MRRTGDPSLLRGNLEAVLGYSGKPWPEGERTEQDVYSAGVLRPLSRLVLAVPSIRIVVPTAEELVAALRAEQDGRQALPESEKPVAPRRGVTGNESEAGRCLHCGASLADRRVDAATCSVRCRMAVSRARRAERSPS